MKKSGIEIFLVMLGIVVILFGCLGGLMVYDSTESGALCWASIASSLVLSAFLFGISQIISHLAYGNNQRKIIIDLLQKQNGQIIQKCPECGEFVIFTNGICPQCGIPLEALKGNNE